MAYSTTLPVLGALAILAAAGGVSLGRSAVSEINPIYFEPARTHFYSDLVPNRGTATGQADFDAGYTQADYAYSAEPACIGCSAYPVDPVPRHDKAVDGEEDGWSASVPVRETVVTVEESVPMPAPANRQWIERYTDYEVSAEPEMVEEAAPAQEES